MSRPFARTIWLLFISLMLYSVPSFSANDTRSSEPSIRVTLQKGRVAYENGDWKTALEEWGKVEPYLHPTSQEYIQLQRLKLDYQTAQRIEKQSFGHSGQKMAAVQVPAEFSGYLSDANTKLQKQIRDLQSRRENSEKEAAFEQAWIETTFNRGMEAFDAGDYDTAFEDWDRISSKMKGQTAFSGQVDGLKRSLREMELKKNQKFPMPDGLRTLLEDAQAKVASDTQALQASRVAMEKGIAGREAAMNESFKEGKRLAAEGKWLEAIYEWENLIPYLDEGSDIKELLLKAKKQWQTLQDAKRSNETFIAARYQEKRMPFAADLEKRLTELDGMMQKSFSDAQSQRASLEKSLADRQTWVETTFEKGKAYYEVGKYKEALEFWGSLSPQLRNDPQIQSMLSSLPERYRLYAQAQSEAEDAEAKKEAPLEPPAGLGQLLDSTAEKLAGLSVEAMSRAEKARAALDAKRSTANRLYEEGKGLADKGQWEGALKAWSALPDYLTDGERIKAGLENLADSHRNYAKALADAQRSEAKLNTRLIGSSELQQVLADAAFKLDKERQATDLMRERNDKILADKQAVVDKLYADGKSLYDQGKLSDAFAAWRSMLPSVDNEKALSESLAKADQSYQMYLASKEQNQQSLTRKDLKLAAPAELSQMLDTVNQQLRDQVFDLKTRSAQTERMLIERKDWIDTTFQKGKLAYSYGRYREAVTEWKTILPFVENGSALEAAVSDFERNLQVSLDASKTNAESEAKRNKKFPAPDELGALLIQLNEKVKNEALEASAEKIRAEQQYSEREKWLKQTFDLGRSFYQEGKYDLAIAEWEKLAPYLEAHSGALQLIDAVKKSYQDSLEAKKGAVEAAAGDYQGLNLPYARQMTQLLNEADAKLKEEASSARTKAGVLEKTIAERQDWAMNTFNKGKVFFDQGNYDEALGQWERLLPYLAEGSDIKREIGLLRESLNVITAARNLAGDGGGEPPVKLRDETEMLSVLESANQRFREEADVLRAKEREAQTSLDQRKQWIEFAFNKGKTYYDQGNFSKAVEEWGVLGPYLGEHPRVREMIEEAKKNYNEGKYAQQMIESMEAKKAALTPLPVEEVMETPPTVEQPSAPATQEIEETPPADPGPETEEEPSGNRLISGEIVSIDSSSRTLTMKLFTESGEDETLTVNFDEHTKVDGSETRSLSGAQSGGSIDVRYDPQTSHAQYIYVY